jgi:uncharacterized protein
MKKNIILIVFVLFCSGSVFGSEFEDTLIKAEQGDIIAQGILGGIYYNGEGVPQDYKQAVYWYKKSADQGDAIAQYDLGIMYYNGEGVPQDYKQAVYWYKKSADQGYAKAQYNLGIMYYYGEGVTQNYKKAYVWESLAAIQGHKKAAGNRNIITKKLSSQQLYEAQELAAKIQYRLNGHGMPPAMQNLENL